MRYYRCKCGQHWSYSSMGVAHCTRCGKCGSDLAEAPELHREPQPHRLVASIDNGDVSVFCKHCLQRMGTLEEAENAEEIRQQIRKLAEIGT